MNQEELLRLASHLECTCAASDDLKQMVIDGIKAQVVQIEALKEMLIRKQLVLESWVREAGHLYDPDMMTEVEWSEGELEHARKQLAEEMKAAGVTWEC